MQGIPDYELIALFRLLYRQPEIKSRIAYVWIVFKNNSFKSTKNKYCTPTNTLNTEKNVSRICLFLCFKLQFIAKTKNQISFRIFVCVYRKFSVKRGCRSSKCLISAEQFCLLSSLFRNIF